VLAKGLSPDDTAVADVMTPSPDSVAPELTVLDALHQMHECRYLHLPVVEPASGRVVGLVDVMEIINATVGQQGSAGWEALFGGAFDDDCSDVASERSYRSAHSGVPRVQQQPRHAHSQSGGSVSGSVVRAQQQQQQQHARVATVGGMNGGATATAGGGFDLHDGDVSDMMSTRDHLDSADFDDVQFVYKVTDAEGNTHRVRASAERLTPLLLAVADKLHCAVPAASGSSGAVALPPITLRYRDEDGDDCVLAGDESLHDAVDMARAAGWTALKLTATVGKSAAAASNTAATAPAAAAAAVTAAGGSKRVPSLPSVPEAQSEEADVTANSSSSSGPAGLSTAMIGGAVVVAAVLAGAALMFMKKK
jgi:CBS domain-containing protein